MPLPEKDILEQQSNQIFDPTKGNFVVYPANIAQSPQPLANTGDPNLITDSKSNNLASTFLNLSDSSDKEVKPSVESSFKFKPEDVDKSGRYNRWVFGVDNENLNHELQSGWDRFGNWGANLVTKAIAYTAQNTGFLLGAPSALASWDVTNMTDNFLTRMGDNMKDWVQNKFPIYKGDKYTHGDIWAKLGTMDWWLDDATDRVALTAAMFVPGLAEAKGLGLASIAEKGLKAMAENPEGYSFLGKTFLPKLYKAASTGVADEGVNPTLASYARSLKRAELMGWNVIGQSGLNGMETQQGIRKYLKEQRDLGKNTLTDDDIEKKAAQGGLRSFWETVPITLAGSALEIPMMFSSMRASKSVLNKIFNPLTGEAITKGLDTELPSIGKTLFKTALTGFEHGQNESMQVAISRYNEENLTGRDNKNTIPGIMGDFLNNINDPNGQNNIALGTIQGILMTLGGVYGQRFTPSGRATETTTQIAKQSLFDVVNRSKLQRRFFNGDFTQRDEKGNIVVDTNGNVKLDQSKLADAGLSLDGVQRTLAVREAAIKAGDKKTLDALNHASLSALAYNFFNDPNGMEHLRGILSVEANEAKKSGRVNDVNENGKEITPDVQLHDNLATIERLKRLHDNIEEVHGGITELDAKKENLPQASKFLSDLKWAQYQEASNQIFLSDRVKEIESALYQARVAENLDIDKEYTKIDHPTSPIQEKYNSLVDDYNTIAPELYDSRERYKTLISKPQAKEAFKQQIEFNKNVNNFVSKSPTSSIKFGGFNISTPEGKEKQIEVGKEYSTTEPFLREGNKLYPSPKLSVLAPAFGGKYNVQLPNNEVTTLNKSQIADYKFTDVPYNTGKIKDIFDKAIDSTLSTEKYKEVAKPTEGQDKVEYINSLDNKELIDDIVKKVSGDIDVYRNQREKEEEELRKLKDNKELQKKLFKSLKNPGINTGNIGDINVVIRKDQEADGSRRKEANVVFSSSTSASELKEPDSQVAPRVVRERNFLFNQSTFPDAIRNNLKALVFTVNSEESLGLKGVTQSVYDNDPQRNTYKIDDRGRGPVLITYVLDRNGKYSFVDQNGKEIGEIGKEGVDKDKIILSTMPDVSPNWRTGESRFRAQDQDKIADLTKWWTDQRNQFFNSKTFIPKEFSVSRGLPVYDVYEENGESKYRENSPVGTLFPKEKADIVFNTQGAIIVADTDSIQHQGIEFKTEPGRIYFKLNDKFAPLSNRKFSEVEQASLYKIIHQLAKEKGQAERLRNYLKNVLYFPDSQGKNIGRNQIWVDKDWNLNLGNNGEKIAFTPTAIEENEALVKAYLSGIYNNTNNQTLKNKFSEPFEEITDIQNDGKYEAKQWKNYQEFLLTKMLSTPIRSLSKEVSNDRNFQQKYAVLHGVDYKAKEEAPIVEKKGTILQEKEFTTSQGEKLSYTVDKDGSVELSKKGDYQKAIERIKGIKAVQLQIEKGVDPEEAAKTFLETAIQSNPPKEVPKAEKKEEKPIGIEDKKADIERRKKEELKVAEEKWRENVDEKGFPKESFQLIEEKINNKYNAELSALEKTTPTTEAKKADIERRRQEELTEFYPNGKWKDPDFDTFLKKYNLNDNTTIKQFEQIINAKYDAELAALEGKKEEKPIILTAPQDNEAEFREVTYIPIDRMGDIEKKEFSQFIKEKLPQFTVQEVDHLLSIVGNRKAWGKLQGDVITLFKAAEKGTGYHEAFEAVWKYFVNSGQQDAINLEVRARKGTFVDRETKGTLNYSDASDKQIKEKLADEFADYKTGKKVSIGRIIREMFDRIINFFRTFLRGYKENTSLVDSLFKQIEKGEFKNYVLPKYLDKSQEFSVVPHLSVSQTNGYVDDITARVMFELLREKADLFDPETYKRNDIFSTVKAQYQGVIANMPEGEETFNKLVEKTKERLATYRISFDENSNVTINDENATKTSYDSSSEKMRLDVKKSQPFAIRLLLGTLYKTKANIDESGNVIGEPIPNKDESSVKGYQLLTPSKTTITLLEALSGSTSIDEMVNRLGKLANEDSDYTRLLSRLGKKNEVGNGIDFSNLTQSQWRMMAGLYDSFNKQKPDVKGIVYRDGEVYFQSMDIGSSQKQIFNTWENNIRRNARNGKGVFQSYDKNLKAFKVDKEKFTKYKEYAKNSVDGQLKFLNDLGINMNRTVYNKLSKNDKDRIFNEGISKIFQYLNDKGGLKTIKARVIGISKPITVISEIYAKASHPDAESTFINGDGEQQQTYIQPNYTSHFENIFNSIFTLDELKKALPQLNDVYARNSEVLKLGGKYFDTEGNRTDAQLRIGYLNASESRNRNRVLKDIDYVERLDTQLNSILDGTYYISVPADGSTEWTIDLPSFVGYSELLSENSIAKINDKMFDYLMAEIDLVSEDRNYINNVGDKAKELRFFKDILSEDNIEKINNEVAIESIDRESLNADFQEYINKEIEKLRTTLQDNKSLYEMPDGKFSWESLLDSYVENNISKSATQKLDLTKEQVDTILKQLVINDFVDNTELHKILFGDPYNFKVKEDSLDETKRIKSFLSPAQPSLVSEAYNNQFGREWRNTNTITDYTPKNIITSTTIKDVIVENALKDYNKVNEADSQAWHSILFHRDLLNRHYKWDKEGKAWLNWELAYTRAKLADKGVNIGEYTEEQKKADKALIENPKPKYTLNVIKPIVRGSKANKDFTDLLLDKFSSAPIWYSAVEGTNLENVFIKMLKEGVDYIIMESGRKAGAEGLHSIYNSDGSFNTLPFNNRIEMGWENYAIQTENQYDESGRQTRGTQITKLFSLDFFEEGKPGDYKGTPEEWNKLTPEEKEKVSEMEKMRNLNNKILNELTIDGYNRTLNKLGLTEKEGTYQITNRKALYKTLRDEAFKRDMPDNLKDVFRLDDKGEPIIPFEATSEYSKIQKMLYSIADRNILSPSHNGGQKTQLSSLGWENKNIKRDFKGGALKFYTKEDPRSEILLPNWFRKRMDPKDTRTDEELLTYLNSTEEGKKILSGIGFRIPTQGMNQIEAFRVKGFLASEYGDTVAVPSEITTKAGSDFDIDKLNTYLRNIYTDNKGDIKSVPFFGFGDEGKAKLKEWLNKDVGEDFLLNEERAKSEEEAYENINFVKEEERAKKSFDRLYTQSLENAYIDNLEWFITHESNFDKLTQPTEGGPLKSIAKDIADMVGEKEDNKLTNLLSVNYLSKLRQQFMSAKKWIGIIVNGITSHAQAQRTQLYLDVENTPLNKKDKEILGDGKILLPHNTTIINGRTLPTLSKLIDKAGKYISDKLSWYTTAMVDVAKDPYITKIIHNKKLVPTFSFLERIGVPTRTVALFMNQPIIREYLKYSDREGFSKLANPWRRDQFLSLGYFPNTKGEAELEIDEFEDCIRGFYHSSKPLGERLTQQQNRYQNLVLNEFLKYFRMSENLFNFTQATNWDTADLKTGGAITKKEFRSRRENNFNVFKTPARILNSTGLATIAKTMVNTKKAIGALSKFETGGIREQLDEILKPYATLEGFQRQEDFERIDGQITNSFIDYLIQTKSKLNESIPKILINESSSTAAKIQAIQRNESELRAFNNNPIFQNLRAQIDEKIINTADNVVLKPFPKSAYDKDLVTGYLREIKELSPDLYGSIVRLALLQGTGKLNNLLGYIPNEDFAKALEPLIQGNIEKDAENYKNNHNFERSNWKDNSIVPEASRLKMYFFETQGLMKSWLHALDKVIKLTDTYNSDLVEYPVIKTRRTIPSIGYPGRYDIIEQRIIPQSEIKEKASKGDYSFIDMVGYQKVMKDDNTPLTSTDKKGNVTYYYKQINLMGTGDNITEHYTDGQPSVIDNNTVKIDVPPNDKDVVEAINPTPVIKSKPDNISPEEGTKETC